MTLVLGIIQDWTDASPDYCTVIPLNVPAYTLEAVPCLAHVGSLNPGDKVLLLDADGTTYVIGKLA